MTNHAIAHAFTHAVPALARTRSPRLFLTYTRHGMTAAALTMSPQYNIQGKAT